MRLNDAGNTSNFTLRTGVAADHIDAFADWLHLQGYRPTSIANGLTSLAAWTNWMLTAGFTTQNVVSGFEACKLTLGKEQPVRHSRGPNQQSIRAAWLFIRFLQLQGKLPPPVVKPCATERWPILAEFRSWMRSHRGLTETTLDVYQGILPGLLQALGDDARAYSAEALRTARFLGTFLQDLSDVPAGAVNYVARQLSISQMSCFLYYCSNDETRRDHAAEIRRHCGFHDFADGGIQFRLNRWLYALCWTGPDRPGVCSTGRQHG